MTYPSIPRCSWLTTLQIFFLACISLCSVFSELWSIGFYISSSSGFFSLLESHSVSVRPLSKEVIHKRSLLCDENNLTQYELTQTTEKLEGYILDDHDFNKNQNLRTIKAAERRFLELEASFYELNEELKLEKEKSAKEQVTFIKALSDLHSFNSNKQRDLEAIIAGLRRDLQAEQLRTSKQTNLIKALTLASSYAISRANTLQRKLTNIEAKVDKSKAQFLEQPPHIYSRTLKDKELEGIPSLSNSELQELWDCMKTDQLPTKLQLYNALQDCQLLKHKLEPTVIGLSKPEGEQTNGTH